MAIKWTEKLLAKPAYKGRVCDKGVRRDVRIMSDVYADLYDVVVWDDEEGKPLSIQYGSSEFGQEATVEIDATKATMKKYRAYMAEKAACAEKAAAESEVSEKAYRLKEAEEAAKREALAVRKGVKAIVVKGRKVPKGTIGMVFWEGGGQYGPRLGLKEEDGTVHWTATSNCVAMLDDVAAGSTPEGGWRSYMETRHEEARAVAALLPKKGEWVKSKETGAAGRVFWTKGTRLGFKMNPRDKSEDPTWADASDVEILTGDPTKGGVVDPRGVEGVDYAADADNKINPLAEMPYPYCAIAKLEIVNGVWKAYSADGVYLIDLTASSAVKLMERLAA